MTIHYNKDHQFLPKLKEALQDQTKRTSWPLFSLLYQYHKQHAIDDFYELQSLQHLHHISFLDYQIETAKKVINEMNGRAILADEVGLGKTIEAGLILKEYLIRGLLKRVLILVPSSLVNQWIEELYEKFQISVTSYRKNYRWDEHPIMIASIDLAKREPHRKKILQLDYDLVIVDEAHRLKNDQTLNYSFVKSIQKKYCLLLTATPVQNDLKELFNLVAIIKPGLLGSRHDFEQSFKDNQKNRKYLGEIVRQVMIRNRRKDLKFDSVERKVKTLWLNFSKEEQKTYEKLEKNIHGLNPFTKLTYLKQLCSSREACYLSLEKARKLDHEQKKHFLEEIAKLPHHIKAKKLVDLLKQIGDEKVIVFTQYRATQYYLQWFLQQYHIPSVMFYGGLKQGRKQWITELFKNNFQVLIATEAGGEGINLQFCRHIINFDLPWNPMQVEQRIGRIHRYGQKHNIKIYNFAIKDTIEEQIIHTLYEKINLFEQVIGKLDHILEKLNMPNLDASIQQMVSQSNTVGEAKVKLHHLFHVLEDEIKNEGAQ